MSELRQLILAASAKLLARKAEALLSLVSVTALSWAVAARSYLAQYMPRPAEEWAVITTAIALASLCLALLAWLRFRPKLRFEKETSAYVDEKTNQRYCPACKHNDNRFVPVGDTDYGWKCPACKKLLFDPARKPEAQPVRGPAYS